MRIPNCDFINNCSVRFRWVGDILVSAYTTSKTNSKASMTLATSFSHNELVNVMHLISKLLKKSLHMLRMKNIKYNFFILLCYMILICKLYLQS